ncbi:hypothetical protein JQC91_13375 [Jannaschia sp. Os4]|uniref:DUF6497 family protein n=1 Tax=Jannaschia sp. Os4 TaxID=2807617 RepID=UPI00193ABA5C|nr:DUF6497 family protein [Jannaschia sp. Os4]MBM2577294.1 hypothetical protein [Jannaschia sp. Os4]
MTRTLAPVLALAAALAPAAAAAQGAPSGQAMALWQVLFERVGSESQMVLRFLAPGIAEGYGQEAALDDLDWLCDAHAVPLAATPYARADSVVVTLMDRPVPRGTTDSEATQFFGLYGIDAGACAPQEY